LAGRRGSQGPAIVERKQILQGVVAESPERLLYVDHIEEQGEQLYEMICRRDMEGIVAKPKESPYRELYGKTPWVKIKNPDYSQAEGRGELFNARRPT
jgi:bifunctional non-homologous end joining protein LigD